MTTRYYVPQAVLDSARPGRTHTDVSRPDGESWVRLGPREAALLLGLSGRSWEELRRRFQDAFSSDELTDAIDRFRALGLLATSPAHGPDVRTQPSRRPFSLTVVVSLVLLMCAAVSLSIMERDFSWSLLAAGRPPFAGAVGLILLAALLHEGGHALAAIGLSGGLVRCRLQLGWLILIPVLRLELSGLWGLSPSRRILVACAGSAAHLVLAAAAIDVWMLWLATAGGPPPLLPWYFATNVALAVVNLLPIYPLDGYWLLSLALDRPRLWQESRAYRASSSLGLAALGAIAVAGVVGF